MAENQSADAAVSYVMDSTGKNNVTLISSCPEESLEEDNKLMVERSTPPIERNNDECKPRTVELSSIDIDEEEEINQYLEIQTGDKQYTEIKNNDNHCIDSSDTEDATSFSSNETKDESHDSDESYKQDEIDNMVKPVENRRAGTKRKCTPTRKLIESGLQLSTKKLRNHSETVTKSPKGKLNNIVVSPTKVFLQTTDGTELANFEEISEEVFVFREGQFVPLASTINAVNNNAADAKFDATKSSAKTTHKKPSYLKVREPNFEHNQDKITSKTQQKSSQKKIDNLADLKHSKETINNRKINKYKNNIVSISVTKNDILSTESDLHASNDLHASASDVHASASDLHASQSARIKSEYGKMPEDLGDKWVIIAGMEVKTEDGDDDKYYMVDDDETEQQETPNNKQKQKFDMESYECTICGRSFSFLSALTLHKRQNHPENKPFSCSQCSMQFRVRYLLKRHIIRYHPDIMDVNDEIAQGNSSLSFYACGDCGKVYSSPNMLTKHKLEKHRGDVDFGHKCFECGMTFSLKESLDVHAKSHSSDNDCLYKCDVCNAGFNNENALTRHKLRHFGKFRLKCCMCNLVFQQICEVSTHMDDTHKSGDRYVCFEVDCDAEFDVYDELQTHFRKCHPKSTLSPPLHVCDTCGKSFSDLAYFKSHVSGHKGVQTHVCHICDRAFTHKNVLAMHITTHGKREIACEVCGAMFPNNHQLRSHQRTHSNARPFQCTTCGMQFKWRTAMTNHIKRVHSELRPFECEFCNHKFSLRGALNTHRKIHLGIKPNVCEFCGKAFVRKKHLRVHMRTHTGEKPYHCYLCERKFTQLTGLRCHARTHPDYDDDIHMQLFRTSTRRLMDSMKVTDDKLENSEQYLGWVQIPDNPNIVENMEKHGWVKLMENIQHTENFEQVDDSQSVQRLEVVQNVETKHETLVDRSIRHDVIYTQNSDQPQMITSANIDQAQFPQMVYAPKSDQQQVIYSENSDKMQVIYTPKSNQPQVIYSENSDQPLMIYDESNRQPQNQLSNNQQVIYNETSPQQPVIYNESSAQQQVIYTNSDQPQMIYHTKHDPHPMIYHTKNENPEIIYIPNANQQAISINNAQTNNTSQAPENKIHSQHIHNNSTIYQSQITPPKASETNVQYRSPGTQFNHPEHDIAQQSTPVPSFSFGSTLMSNLRPLQPIQSQSVVREVQSSHPVGSPAPATFVRPDLRSECIPDQSGPTQTHPAQPTTVYPVPNSIPWPM